MQKPKQCRPLEPLCFLLILYSRKLGLNIAVCLSMAFNLRGPHVYHILFVLVTYCVCCCSLLCFSLGPSAAPRHSLSMLVDYMCSSQTLLVYKLRISSAETVQSTSEVLQKLNTIFSYAFRHFTCLAIQAPERICAPRPFPISTLSLLFSLSPAQAGF